MASNSERTFDSRLAHAEKITSLLSSFVDYAPLTTDQALTSYQSLIATVKALNATTMASIH